jgi:hypothetical protein
LCSGRVIIFCEKKNDWHRVQNYICPHFKQQVRNRIHNYFKEEEKEERHSSAFISFHPVRSATVSSSSVTFFSSMSAKVSAFSRLDVVKLLVRLARHTGMRTFIIVVVAGNGNL